jgi:predicted peptidase
MHTNTATIRRRTRWMILTLLLASTACAGGDGTEPGAQPDPTNESAAPEGPSSGRMTVKPAGTDGAPLGYLEYLPPGYGDGTPRPLLVFLHGAGESGSGDETALDAIFKLGIPRLIQDDEWPGDRPFIVLMPQYGVDDAEDCQLADEVDAFLAFANEQYDVDEERVYLTGVSCGAIGAWDYLATYGEEVVSAAVLIDGHAEDAFAKAGCSLAEIPVWVFHGDADSIVPIRYVEDRVASLEACDPPPEDLQLTVYPGVDHTSWSRTYDLSAGHDVYAWLLEHSSG